MITRNAEGVARRKTCDRLRTVGELVTRSTECGFQESVIAHPRLTAMLGKLFVVNGQYDVEFDPDRLGQVASRGVVYES